jgi:hypothetical protein
MSFSVSYDVGYWHENSWGCIQLALNKQIGFYTITVTDNTNYCGLGAASYTTNTRNCTSYTQLGERTNMYCNNGQHYTSTNQINCTCNYSNQLIFYYSFAYNSVRIRIDYIGTASSKTGELWSAIYPYYNL